MPKVAIDTDKVDVGSYGASPTTEGQHVNVTTTQTFVKINSVLVVVGGDSVETHNTYDNNDAIIDSHAGATMIETPELETDTPRPIQTYVTIDGKAIMVNGDKATCSHTIVGTGFVTIAADPPPS